MSNDARHIRELETRCSYLEQAFLVQEKRVWSQTMLKQLERGTFMGDATPEARASTQALLEGNLRVAREVLDRLARDLGYEQPTVFRLLDPEFVYGAPGPNVGPALTQQLERLDAREREQGTSHLACLLRDLKTRHDEFLAELSSEVRRDVDLHTLMSDLVQSEDAET